MPREFTRFSEAETEELRQEVNHFISIGRTEADAFRALAEKGNRKEYSYRDKWNSLKRKKKETNHKPYLLDAVKELIDENVTLKSRVSQLEKQVEVYRPMQDEYQSLLQIINTARKMAFVPDMEQKQKFKMDKNGNLERLEDNRNDQA